MPISVLKTPSEVREHLREARASGERAVVLVPTMGALHEGHAALIRRGRELAGEDGRLVVSVFVNPTQFGPNEDLAAYPRALESDQAICEDCGADVLFAPGTEDMYAPDHSITVQETRISGGMCGASRPGHFAGVCLVVMKLFGIVQPTHAVFGKKDYQQLAVIRRLVRDLEVPVEVEAVETVREEDGLAMSSRNKNLTEAERQAAPEIRAALLAGKRRWEKTPDMAPSVLLRLVRSRLEQVRGGRIDYVELAGAENLEPVEDLRRPVVMAAAVKFSRARLIDNIELGIAEGGPHGDGVG